MSNRLFVVGGTGYLGGEVVRQARAQGWQVVASYYSQVPSDNAAGKWVFLDARDALAVEQVCMRLQPDVIINAVYRQSGADMWTVTALGAEHIARAAHACQARLIHISSDMVFDGEQTRPYCETDLPNPVTAYGAAKADAERLVVSAHNESVLVRTSLIYGFDPIDRHTRFILDMADGRLRARLFRDEYRCPIFVGDLAAALLELSTHSYQGVLHVAGASALSRYQFGVLLATFYGRDATRIESGLNAESETRRPRNCVLDIHLAQQFLTSRLRSVQDVLFQQKRPDITL